MKYQVSRNLARNLTMRMNRLVILTVLAAIRVECTPCLMVNPDTKIEPSNDRFDHIDGLMVFCLIMSSLTLLVVVIGLLSWCIIRRANFRSAVVAFRSPVESVEVPDVQRAISEASPTATASVPVGPVQTLPEINGTASPTMRPIRIRLERRL